MPNLLKLVSNAVTPFCPTDKSFIAGDKAEKSLAKAALPIAWSTAFAGGIKFPTVGEIILVSYKSNNLFLLSAPKVLVLYRLLVNPKYFSSSSSLSFLPCLVKCMPIGFTAAWAKVLVGR